MEASGQMSRAHNLSSTDEHRESSPPTMSKDESGDKLSRTPTSWDAEDDALLMHLKDQQKLGWKAIASHFNNRTPNACQFRWRRLKSGNLKNPPKTAALDDKQSPPKKASPPATKKKKYAFPNSKVGFGFYDNNVSNALAGLNALSNTSAAVASPVPFVSAQATPTPQTTSNYEHTPDSLDPQVQVPRDGGGYYVDISVDPTMNLPHNKPAPHAPVQGLTPRSSASGPSLNHNNSIIQIVRDERNSVAAARDSIAALPAKSMNIPHHQATALAHLPVFGGSVSGPSTRDSVAAMPALRGSVAGYYSRAGSVVIPLMDKKDDKKKRDKRKPVKQKPLKSEVLKLPWSMDEDELLINRRNRELSFAELSILLPQRTEGEIWARIDYLENLRNGVRSSIARERRRRQSSIGLDDVEDFYMSDMGSDEDDDEVLVDVDDAIPHGPHRKIRRRTSSTPLVVHH